MRKRRRRRKSTLRVCILVLILICVGVYIYQFKTFNITIPSLKKSKSTITYERGKENVRNKDRTNIIILSQPRSGSSTIGQMFNTSPDAFYLFEPFRNIPFSTPGVLQGILDCSIFKEKSVTERILWWYAKKMMNWYHSENVDPESTCRSRRIHAYKTIRLRNVDKESKLTVQDVSKHLQSFGKQFKIIHLVRHPGAVWASQRKLGWRWKRDDETWINDICRGLNFDVDVLATLSGKTPEVLFVRYDDLVQDIRGTVQSILKFSDSENRDIESIVTRIESTNSHLFVDKKGNVGKKKMFRTKNVDRMLNGWEKKLDHDQKALLHNACFAVCEKLGFQC